MTIKINNVTKRFKKKEIFKDFNYEFEKGKTYVILGDNGVGKSVLLKLLCGYSICDKGEITIDDITLGKDSDFLQNAGILINSPNFISYMSGLDNLLMIASIRKICNKTNILNLAHTFEMSDEINRLYRKYSLGTKQKLRLIQVLMENPEYLILDEPFNGLDKKVKKIFIDILKEEHEKNKTIFITSHYMEEIMHLDCDVLELTHNHLQKVAVIRNEKLISIGDEYD